MSSSSPQQFALLGETAAMAFDTLRSNKMRSALTVLGVVIGVTSIVGMTSAHPRLRHLAAQLDQLARPEYDLRAEVRRAQFRSELDVHAADAAAEISRPTT
jgi:ABC-type antimicrobial peptide transport system permease subunit